MLTENPARLLNFCESWSNAIVWLVVVPSCAIETFPPWRRKSLNLLGGVPPPDWGEASSEGVLPLSDGGGEAAARIPIGCCKKICAPIVTAPLSGHSSWSTILPFLSKLGLSGALCPKGAAFTLNA